MDTKITHLECLSADCLSSEVCTVVIILLCNLGDCGQTSLPHGSHLLLSGLRWIWCQ